MPTNHTIAPINPPVDPVQANEEALAASLLLEPRAAERTRIFSHFEQSDIQCPAVAAVVAALRTLHESGVAIDPLRVMNELVKKGHYDPNTDRGIVTPAILSRIQYTQGTASNGVAWAIEVRAAATQRLIVAKTEQISQLASDPARAEQSLRAGVELAEFIQRRQGEHPLRTLPVTERLAKFGALPAGEIVRLHPKQKPWVIEGIARKGDLTAITGASKASKTWYALGMAFAVARGEEWLGRRTSPGLVLLLDMECTDETISDRVQKIAAHLGCEIPPNLIVRGFRDSIDQEREVSQLLLALQSGEVVLLIVDPFYTVFAGRDGANENDNAMVTQALTRLRSFARHLDAATVAIQHAAKGANTAKGSERDAIDFTSGAGAFARVPDNLVTLRAHADKDYLVQQIKNRTRVSPPDASLRLVYPQTRRCPDGDGIAYELAPEVPARLIGKKASNDNPAAAAAETQPAFTVQHAAELILGQPGSTVQLTAALAMLAERTGSQAQAKRLLATVVSCGQCERWKQGSTVFVGRRKTPLAASA